MAALLFSVPASADCTAPADLVKLQAPLPRLVAAVRESERIRIVALGSSSTWGAGASSRARAYPARLESELRTAWPKADVRVINAGVNGELARNMLARIGQQVTPHNPQLVIWQTGVNDAIRGVPLDTFRLQVRTGIERLRATGADVVLIDQQYYPGFKSVKDGPLYLAALRDTAAQFNVPVVQRFRIMQHLISSAQFTTATLLSPDQFHLNDRSYDCLGHLLAQSLRSAAALAPAGETAVTKGQARM
ncbi:SGNH/GDSL hydrolase family protein [Hyphomicrobium sp.]|uniref:SGNH/GDSL hydrolase family protein n=1 Tax=Hyphomicrobium sp. TaxID=82 RepID=UPI002E369E5D|nr:GDSL-type esterase/lipase family protein [Hyphomicrobium sp.]HEX2842383.1 GDSL-type esterase/lipase family protein [Hyphomicrobium sp.]